MKQRGKRLKKILFVFIGVLVAMTFSIPYIIFHDQIREKALLGYVGLFFACAISNLTILIPSSSTLIVLTATTALNPWLCIFCGGLGTALGEQSSYVCGLIGTIGLDVSVNWNQKVVNAVKRHAFLTVFIFAFVPLPVFDIAGIVAGATRMNWVKYTAAAVLGKTLKFFLAVAGVFYIIPRILKFLPGSWDQILERAFETLEARYRGENLNKFVNSFYRLKINVVEH